MATEGRSRSRSPAAARRKSGSGAATAASPKRKHSPSSDKKRSSRTATAVAAPKARRAPAAGKAANNRDGGLSTFQHGIWWTFAIQNWLLDFGRPIGMLFVQTPLNQPSLGDYFHMAYNIITPFCLLKLLENSPRKVSTNLQYAFCLFLVMGASIHLVGDSVNTRLIHVGYQNHLPVRQNPLMQALNPPEMIDFFELLYLYDEYVGHLMWYIPFFAGFVIYFAGCFMPANAATRANSTVPTSAAALLMPLSASYFWYLTTEGQIFPLFLVMFVTMLVVYWYEQSRGNYLDCNGRFMILTFAVTIGLVALWSAWLSDDEVLRARYPGLLYVPEPWSFYTLHWHGK